MIEMNEMDDSVTLQQQMAQEVGPVILINQFKVKREEADQLVEAWAADAAFFSSSQASFPRSCTEASVEVRVH